MHATRYKKQQIIIIINIPINKMPALPLEPSMILLIVSFWLSGLWILSLIFTAETMDHLEQTNMFMFITLGVGSLVGGYLSDIIDRILVFKVVSAIWLAGAAITLVSMEAGYIVTAGCIGLLNNLTFVIIMEKWPEKKDQYTIYVLLGWAASEITLGLLFYVIHKSEHYFWLLLTLTLIYTVATFALLDSTPRTTTQQVTNAQQKQSLAQSISLYKKVLPHSLLSLLGGCVLMFVMQMFYYRTQFTLDRFGVSLQLNTIIVGVMEIIANLLFTRVINRYSRKVYLRAFLIVLMLLFMMLVIVESRVAQSFIEGIMRLFDTGIMIVLGIYLPELFDQDERGKGTNYVMSFGVLGSALNSVILNSFQFWQLIFFLVLGFVSTFCFRQKVRKESLLLKQQQSHINADQNI